MLYSFFEWMDLPSVYHKYSPRLDRLLLAWRIQARVPWVILWMGCGHIPAAADEKVPHGVGGLHGPQHPLVWRVQHHGTFGEPQTLNPKLQTLNPEPSTLHPKI